MLSEPPTVHLRFMSGKEVTLKGKSLRHLLRHLRADMPTAPGQYRGFNFELYDKDGKEVEPDADLNDGAEYMVVVSEVCQNEVLVEIDESVDVMMWSCKHWYREICDCDNCDVRPPGKGCRACGMHRFTGKMSKCPTCLRNNRDSAAWRRQRNRELGLCPLCRSPAEDGRVQCRSCNDKANAYRHARNVLKKAK